VCLALSCRGTQRPGNRAVHFRSSFTSKNRAVGSIHRLSQLSSPVKLLWKTGVKCSFSVTAIWTFRNSMVGTSKAVCHISHDKPFCQRNRNERGHVGSTSLIHSCLLPTVISIWKKHISRT